MLWSNLSRAALCLTLLAACGATLAKISHGSDSTPFATKSAGDARLSASASPIPSSTHLSRDALRAADESSTGDFQLLGISFLTQPQNTQLCWATCARMITEFVNPHKVTPECTWAEHVFGAQGCCESGALVSGPCNEPHTLTQADFDYFKYTVGISDAWPSWVDMANNLDVSAVALTEENSSEHAHMVVAHGYVRGSDWMAAWDPQGDTRSPSMGQHNWFRYQHYKDGIGDFQPGPIYSNVAVEPSARRGVTTADDPQGDGYGSAADANAGARDFVSKYGAEKPELFDLQPGDAANVGTCPTPTERLVSDATDVNLAISSYCVGADDVERGVITATQLSSNKWATLHVLATNAGIRGDLRRARALAKSKRRKVLAVVVDLPSGKWFLRVQTLLPKKADYLLVSQMPSLQPAQMFTRDELLKQLRP